MTRRSTVWKSPSRSRRLNHQTAPFLMLQKSAWPVISKRGQFAHPGLVPDQQDRAARHRPAGGGDGGLRRGVHADVGGGDELGGERGGGLLRAQCGADQDTGILRQAPREEVRHVFGLPPSLFGERAAKIRLPFGCFGMSPKYELHRFPRLLHYRLPEYTVYTVSRHTQTRETDMSNTAPRKPAVKKITRCTQTCFGKGSSQTGKENKKEKKADAKVKVVRDSFTMPQTDYDLIAALKQKALKAGLHVKKSELLRASLQAFSKLSAAQLKRAISGLEKIKTGRPKKD